MAKVFAFQEYKVGYGNWSDLYELDSYDGSIYFKETEIEYKETTTIEFRKPLIRDASTVRADILLDVDGNVVSVTPNPNGKNEIQVDAVYGEGDVEKHIREYYYIRDKKFSFKLSKKQPSKPSKASYDVERISKRKVYVVDDYEKFLEVVIAAKGRFTGDVFKHEIGDIHLIMVGE